MITQRPYVNGIIAAVLSAGMSPMHGAFAKEAKPETAKHATRHNAKKAAKPAENAAPAETAPAEASTPMIPDGAESK